MVMLAPPNQGSELADILSQFFFYRRVMGPAAAQLGTSLTVFRTGWGRR